MPPRTHGHGRGTPMQRKAFRAWVHAKERCFKAEHPEFKRYGARGITMAPEWVNDYAAFAAHIGLPQSSDFSLDRIDNDGNYEPGNVRWATRAEQNANRRQGNQKPVRTLEALPEIRRLHAEGRSTREIAAEVGLGKSQVWLATAGYYDEA